VQQEAARRPWDGAERFLQQTEGSQAVNGGRAIQFNRKGHLSAETIELGVDVGIFDPAVEADFTNDRLGMSLKMAVEHGEPVGAAFFDVPRMQAESGANPSVLLGQLGDLGPVFFAGTIDDHLGEAGLSHLGDDLIAPGVETLVLEVVVGVVEHGENDETRMANDE
jgi:hypothetical protein